MQVVVDCFGVTRRLAGGAEHPLELPGGARIADALAALAVRVPALGEVLPRCAVAVGADIVPRTRVLVAGERLALLPPVSGG